MFSRKLLARLVIFVLLFNISSPLLAAGPSGNDNAGLETAIAGIIKLGNVIAAIETSCKTFPSWAPKQGIINGCQKMRVGIKDFKNVLAMKPGESKAGPALAASWKFFGGFFSTLKPIVEITGKVALKLAVKSWEGAEKAQILAAKDVLKELFENSMQIVEKCQALAKKLEAAGQVIDGVDALIALSKALKQAWDMMNTTETDGWKMANKVNAFIIEIGKAVCYTGRAFKVPLSGVGASLFDMASWVQENQGFANTPVMQAAFAGAYSAEENSENLKLIDAFAPTVVEWFKHPKHKYYTRIPIRRAILAGAGKETAGASKVGIVPYREMVDQLKTALEIPDAKLVTWQAKVNYWLNNPKKSHEMVARMFKFACCDDNGRDNRKLWGDLIEKALGKSYLK